MGRVRAWRPTLVALGFGLVAPSAPAGGVEPIVAETIVSGLTLPVYLTHAPGDPYRVYIVEKAGRIKILDLRDPGAGTILFLDIDALVGGGQVSFDERGLLGLAFHPDYENNGLFFLHFTSAGGMMRPPTDDSVFAEFVRVTPDSAEPEMERILLVVDQPSTNHNGGWLGFGPNDSFLYASLGDGGGQNGEFLRAQNTGVLNGSILRLDVDGSNSSNGEYGIPETNPFVDEAGLDEIWSFGLRNPWRCSFDRATGDLYIGDVGQGTLEEISFQPASSEGRENYGWRCFEGTNVFSVTGACNPAPATVMPFHTYSHIVSPFGCSVTGGYVYRGSAIPTLDGEYFFADFCTDDVWTIDVIGGVAPIAPAVSRNAELESGGVTLNSIASFGEDAFGELYIVDQNGSIHRIEPQSGINDCNANNVDDAGEIALGLLADANGNGIPDICGGPCPGDANGDREVNFADVTSVLGNWLADYTQDPSGTGPGDANGDGVVDFSDVTETLGNWLAACP